MTRLDELLMLGWITLWTTLAVVSMAVMIV